MRRGDLARIVAESLGGCTVLRGNDSGELGVWANRLTERLATIPGFADVSMAVGPRELNGAITSSARPTVPA